MTQFTRPRAAAARLIVVVLASSASSRLQAEDAPAIGTQVVIKAGATLKVGDKVVEAGKNHRIYKVARANGAWLWLTSGNVAGWVQSSNAIPLDRAIDVYTAEIERNPHAPGPHFNRGLIHHDRRDFDKALGDYSEAVRQDANFVPALINRGNIWLLKRDYDRAITDYAAAIRLEPRDILAHLNRAIAWQSKQDFDKALEDYDEAIRLGLKTASVYNNRGHAREMKRDYDRAVADYTEAIRLDPTYLLAWINRGSARQSKGEFEQALADDSEATRLDPESPWGYARSAWILATCPVAKLRDGKKAVELASKACELAGPTEATFLDVRAAAFAEAGEFAKAVYWETKAVGLAANAPAGDGVRYRLRLKLYQEQKPFRDGASDPPSS